MKKTVSVPFDDEKLSALRLYLEQKGTTVEAELASACEMLYTKTVPGNVREYIGLKAGAPKPAQKKALSPKIAAGLNTEKDGSEKT